MSPSACSAPETRITRIFSAASSASIRSRFAVKVGYDDEMAHKIEAGSDMFLMPSRYEPCGLNQIYSLKYGTVPIVRATGGLDDTIESYDIRTGKGTGFKFHEYTPEALLTTMRAALALFAKPNGVAQAHAQRHGPRFFMGSLRPRVSQGLRKSARRASCGAGLEMN